jgi:extradiol dioxygenase family protein
VDGHHVPVPHFGIVLNMKDWQSFANRLSAAGTQFDVEPHIRFKGQPGEQATMFFRDPKAFEHLDQLFAK